MENKKLSEFNLEYTKEMLDSRNSKIIFQDDYVKMFIDKNEVDSFASKKIIWHLVQFNYIKDEIGFIEYAAMKMFLNNGIKLKNIVMHWNATIISTDYYDLIGINNDNDTFFDKEELNRWKEDVRDENQDDEHYANCICSAIDDIYPIKIHNTFHNQLSSYYYTRDDYELFRKHTERLLP